MSLSLSLSDFQLFSFCFVQFPHSKKSIFLSKLSQFLIFSYAVSRRKRAAESLLYRGIPAVLETLASFSLCILSLVFVCVCFVLFGSLLPLLLTLPRPHHWQRFKFCLVFFTAAFWDPIFSAWVPRVLNPGPRFPRPTSPIKPPGACVFAASLVPLARGTLVNLFWDHLTQDGPNPGAPPLLTEPPEWQHLPGPARREGRAAPARARVCCSAKRAHGVGMDKKTNKIHF